MLQKLHISTLKDEIIKVLEGRDEYANVQMVYGGQN